MPKQPAPVVGFALAGVVEIAMGISLIAAIGPASIAFFFLVTGVCTVALASQVGKLLRPVADGPGGGSRGAGGGDEPGPSDPDWWPAFEAAFRDHVGKRDAKTLIR